MATLWNFDTTWDWQQVDLSTITLPAIQPLPTTGWQTPSKAPFGTQGTSSLTAFEYEINSEWETRTGVWLRKTFAWDGSGPIMLSGRIKNAFYVYFDGEFVGYWNFGNLVKPGMPEWKVFIPADLATKDNHTLHILAFDRPDTPGTGLCYVYCKAEGCPPMVAVPPEAGAREALEWKTDVLEANDGTEQRLQLRSAPRQQFTYTYPASAQDVRRMFNTLHGSYADTWLIPVWPQAQRIAAPTVGGGTITMDTTKAELRDSSVVLLWESPTKWELAGVQFMTSSVLTITQGVRLEFNNPWVMPVRLGRIVKDPSKTTNGYGATFEVGYEVSDNVALASTGWSDFEGDDASTDEILMPGDTTSGVIHRNVDLHDEDLGRTYWRSPWARSRTSMNRAIIAANAQEAWDFRLWLHRRAGRFRPFWEPSFEDDIRLLDDPDNLIVDSIAIASDSFERYAGDSQTVALAIETDDGWRLVRTLSWERYTTGDKIAVYFAEELNIPVVAIHRVCYLGLKRLDTDRIELRWVGGGVLQTEFTTVELAG